MKHLLLLLTMFISFELQGQVIDIYSPKPFSEILNQSFNATWTPTAVASIENLQYLVLIDQSNQTDAIVLNEADRSEIEMNSTSTIHENDATYSSLLRSIFQIVDINTANTSELAGKYVLHPLLHSYFGLDYSSTNSEAIISDAGTYYTDATSAYVVIEFTGTAAATQILASDRYVYNTVTETFEASSTWTPLYLKINGSTLEFVANQVDGSTFLLANALDLIDLDIAPGTDFNPNERPYQENGFAPYPENASGYENSTFYKNSFLNKIDDAYETQFGSDAASDAAAAAALDAIETSLTAEGSSLRYDKSVYLAFRENLLARTLAANDLYNCPFGEETVAYVYFTNAADDAGVRHPFMVIASHNASDSPNYLIDVARPPGEGIPGLPYSEQRVTRNAVFGDKLIKIPLKDYGLISNLTDNDLTPYGGSLAEDEGLTSEDFDVYNYAALISMGIATDGVVIFPAYNNTLSFAAELAEISKIGIHVGRGMGLYYHADGHSENGNGLNLYNLDDYTAHNHPPLIAFSFDGLALFGKYKTTHASMEGYDVPLDEYGGHDHDGLGYHYHAFAEEQTLFDNNDNPTGTYDQHFLFVGAWKGIVNVVPGFYENTNSQLNNPDIARYAGAPHVSSLDLAPNIVFILVDDMGWNGSSVQMMAGNASSASDYYLTPALESLAEGGMTFSQGYAPAPKCSPTRCSVLTGQTPARNKFTTTDTNVETDRKLIPPASTILIDSDDMTVAEWLHDTGLNYRTAHYGKWDLRNGGTAAHGFDFGDGETGNAHGTTGEGVPQTDPKQIFGITDRAISFMQTAVADNVPFYVQLSHYAVHSPIEATPEMLANMPVAPEDNLHSDPDFGAMTQDLDASIAQLLTEIESLKTATDRPFYIIFLSDNGASRGLSNNAPLRRGKNYIYEGGIRVPFIIKGPNTPTTGYSDEPIVGYDLFPTIAEWVQNATGIITDLPADLDGQSIASLVTEEAFSRVEPLYFHGPHYSASADKSPRSAVISGNYKLIVEYETGINYLYNLAVDIGESNNVLAENATLARDLCIQLRDYLKASDADLPLLNPTHSDFSGLGGTATDVDNDGLEDAWEFRELLSYHYGPDDDPDGDNQTNMEEFNAGTDPYVTEAILATEEVTDLKAVVLFNQGVQLSWSNTRINTIDFYEIERSADGLNWQTIGKTAATTTQFIDENLLNGLVYYRLKLINLDTTIDYTRSLSIYIKNEDSYLLYPNPTDGFLTLHLSPSFKNESRIKVQISQTDGRLARSFDEQKAATLSFDLSTLAKGTYLLTIWMDGQVIGESSMITIQ